MLIDKIPVSSYGAKQLTVDFAPSTQDIKYEWNPGARLPMVVDQRTTFKNMTVALKVTGSSRQEIEKNISHISRLTAGETEYKLDNYPGWVFIGTLQETPTSQKTIKPNVYKLTIKATGYMRDEAQKVIEIERKEQEYIFADGTRDTPIMIEITPEFDLSTFGVYGIAERGIEIKNLSKGHTVYIDGMTGTVMQDGQNKFNDVIMFEFPHLQPGEQIISFSERTCKVVIRYYPMWM